MHSRFQSSAMFVFTFPVLASAAGFFLEMERNLACHFVCSNMESCAIGGNSYCADKSSIASCQGIYYTSDGSGNYCTLQDDACDTTSPLTCESALAIYQAYVAVSELNTHTHTSTTESPMWNSTSENTETTTIAANQSTETTTEPAMETTTFEPDWTSDSTTAPESTDSTSAAPETSTFSAINTFPTNTITTEAPQPSTTTAYVFHPFRRP